MNIIDIMLKSLFIQESLFDQFTSKEVRLYYILIIHGWILNIDCEDIMPEITQSDKSKRIMDSGILKRVAMRFEGECYKGVLFDNMKNPAAEQMAFEKSQPILRTTSNSSVGVILNLPNKTVFDFYQFVGINMTVEEVINAAQAAIDHSMLIISRAAQPQHGSIQSSSQSTQTSFAPPGISTAKQIQIPNPKASAQFTDTKNAQTPADTFFNVGRFKDALRQEVRRPNLPNGTMNNGDIWNIMSKLGFLIRKDCTGDKASLELQQNPKPHCIIRTTGQAPDTSGSPGIVISAIVRNRRQDINVKAIIGDETEPKKIEEKINTFIKNANKRTDIYENLPGVDTLGPLIRESLRQPIQPDQPTSRVRSNAVASAKDREFLPPLEPLGGFSSFQVEKNSGANRDNPDDDQEDNSNTTSFKS